jgi:hypothetical protein
LQHGASGTVGQGMEDRVELLGLIFNHVV